MFTDEDFRQAIGDNPDDLQLQLIYADWLEERGDPQAELVRKKVSELDLVLQELERQKEGETRRQEREQRFARVRRRSNWLTWCGAVAIGIGVFCGLWLLMARLNRLPAGTYEFRHTSQGLVLTALVTGFLGAAAAFPWLLLVQLKKDYPEFLKWGTAHGAGIHWHWRASLLFAAFGLMVAVALLSEQCQAAVFTETEFLSSPKWSFGRVDVYSYNRVRGVYRVTQAAHQPCYAVLLDDGELWCNESWKTFGVGSAPGPDFPKFVAEKADVTVQEVSTFHDIPRSRDISLLWYVVGGMLLLGSLGYVGYRIW